MVTLNMIGGGFQHEVCSTAHNVPKHIVWDKSRHEGDISVHIDDSIFNIPVNPTKVNVALFSESPYFTQRLQSYLLETDLGRQHAKKFKHIFSCDKEFLKKHPEAQYVVPTACPWVKDRQIFPKTKTVSIVASAKRAAPGHQLRHMVIETYKGHLDVYGGGYNPIPEKGVGLNDYMFSFAIENIKVDGYFTEKIADCFATGTIPVYWGDSTISDHFLEEGIVRITDDFDVLGLTKDLYMSKMEAVKENFRRAMEFPCSEDYMYLNYLK